MRRVVIMWGGWWNMWGGWWSCGEGGGHVKRMVVMWGGW